MRQKIMAFLSNHPEHGTERGRKTEQSRGDSRKQKNRSLSTRGKGRNMEEKRDDCRESKQSKSLLRSLQHRVRGIDGFSKFKAIESQKGKNKKRVRGNSAGGLERTAHAKKRSESGKARE